jgi:hydrogenase maturation protease
MSLHQNSFSEVLALADIRGHLPATHRSGGTTAGTAGRLWRQPDRHRARSASGGGAGRTYATGCVGIVPQTNDETRCLNYECLSMENYEGVRIRQYRVTLER